MTGGIESVGEAVTGGMAARAVEPAAGEGHGRPGACLNCGTELVGPHCHRCGQAGHVHRTLGAFWHDLAHSVLHFDGKLWRTLPLLAWRPGELTRRYVAGERAKFVSPMALFLFSVFLMFAIFSSIGGPFGGDSMSELDRNPAQERAEARRDFERERTESLAELKQLQVERARLAAARQSTADVDREIFQLRSKLALEEKLFNQALALISAEEKREIRQARAEEEAKVAGPAREAAEQADEGNLVVLSGADSLNQWFRDAYRKAKENPSLLIYKLQTNAYKFSWALIPISVPFLWLLFLHRRRYRRYKAYDHTVFVTYSIAFMSLGVIALSLLRLIGVPEVIAGFAITLRAAHPHLPPAARRLRFVAVERDLADLRPDQLRLHRRDPVLHPAARARGARLGAAGEFAGEEGAKRVLDVGAGALRGGDGAEGGEDLVALEAGLGGRAIGRFATGALGGEPLGPKRLRMGDDLLLERLIVARHQRHHALLLESVRPGEEGGDVHGLGRAGRDHGQHQGGKQLHSHDIPSHAAREKEGRTPERRLNGGVVIPESRNPGTGHPRAPASFAVSGSRPPPG